MILWPPKVDLVHGDPKENLRHACCLEIKKRAEEEKCCWCEQPSSKLCSPAVGLLRYSVRLNGVPAFVSKFRQQFCQKTGFWSLPELLQGTVNKQNTQLVLFFHCFTSGEGEGFEKFAVKHTDAIIWNCFLRLSETDYQGSMGKYFLNSLKLLKSLKCKGDQEWFFFVVVVGNWFLRLKIWIHWELLLIIITEKQILKYEEARTLCFANCFSVPEMTFQEVCSVVNLCCLEMSRV